MIGTGTISEFVPLSRSIGVGQVGQSHKRVEMGGTKAGQVDLKALAHKVLQRDKLRDKVGTSVGERAGQKGGFVPGFVPHDSEVCPKVVPADLKACANALRERRALDEAIESLLPAGRLEWFAGLTDPQIEEYARRFGVTGPQLMAAIFDPQRNRELYAKMHGGRHE